MRVGISLMQYASLNGRSGWVAGLYYIKNCLNALALLPSNSKPKIIAFVPNDFTESLLLPENSHDSDWLKVINIPCDQYGNSVELQKYIDENPCDLYFPFNTIPTFHFTAPMIGWVPDFQHKHLPHFFSESEKKDRDLTTEFFLKHSSKLVCISQNVADDIEKFHSAPRHQLAVLPFKSFLSSSNLIENTQTILEKYGITKKYIFLPNQFWVHKNHKTVFEAWHQLKSNGHDFLLVCTGKTNDYRHPHYFEELNAYIKNNNLENTIRILGFIDRDDQLQLFRNASAVLQPSLFEGWNTSIEDAKALGKTLIVSDLDIHHEQCGEDAYYFDKNNPTALANLIHKIWDSLPKGYEKNREEKARISYKEEIKQYAENLFRMFKSAISSPIINDINERDLIIKLNSELQVAQAHLNIRFDVIAELKEAIDNERAIVHSNQEYINNLKHQIEILNRKLRQTFIGLSRRVIGKIRRTIQHRIDLFMTHKLGELHLYPPKPLHVPARYKKNKNQITLPSISIVTPSFNHGKFIERTIKSIVEQKYPRLEYIIQDGNSDDETIDIIKRYEPSITHWKSIKDNGQANAINLGFRHATGEIMAYLNSDDILLPGTLNYIGNFFKKHPEVDVVYSHRVLINEHDQEIGRWILPPHDAEILSWADYVPQETLFWRRSIWEKIGSHLDENFCFALDWDLLLRFREAGAKFVRLPRFLGAFRVHPNQKTSAQISETGEKEMQLIRQRCHGRAISPDEVSAGVDAYLKRHIFYHKLYEAGLLQY